VRATPAELDFDHDEGDNARRRQQHAPLDVPSDETTKASGSAASHDDRTRANAASASVQRVRRRTPVTAGMPGMYRLTDGSALEENHHA
jgi:hypothetical protein